MKKFVSLLMLLNLALLLGGCATTQPKRGRTPALVPSIWPIADANSSVSSKYGLRGEGSAARVHNGIDISAPRDAIVVSTADGIVTFSGRAGSYGKAILVTHGNGVETCYAHLHKRLVKKGKQVMQGQPIGKIGHSGRADGNHLHYEVRIYGAPSNPAPFLPAGPTPVKQEEKPTGA